MSPPKLRWDLLRIYVTPTKNKIDPKLLLLRLLKACNTYIDHLSHDIYEEMKRTDPVLADMFTASIDKNGTKYLIFNIEGFIDAQGSAIEIALNNNKRLYLLKTQYQAVKNLCSLLDDSKQSIQKQYQNFSTNFNISLPLFETQKNHKATKQFLKIVTATLATLSKTDIVDLPQVLCSNSKSVNTRKK